MGNQNIISLGRSLDPGYWTNRIVIAASVVAGAVAGAYGGVTGVGGKDIAVMAFGAVFSVFLPWALARELDPDNEKAALVAIPFGGASYALWGTHVIIGGLALLLCIRITNKSTGIQITYGDVAATCAIALVSAYVETPLILLPVALGFFIADGAPHAPALRAAGMVCAIVCAALLWQSDSAIGAADAWVTAATVVALIIFFGWRASIRGPPASFADTGAVRLERIGLTQAAAVAVVAAGILTTVYEGDTKSLSGGIWAALAGIATYGIVARISPRVR